MQLRHENPVLRCRHFLHGRDEPAPGILDIAWFDTHGEVISSDSWNNPEKRLFALRRASKNGDGTVTILTLFLNPSGQDRVFRLPTQNVPTRVLIDSTLPGKPENDVPWRGDHRGGARRRPHQRACFAPARHDLHPDVFEIEHGRRHMGPEEETKGNASRLGARRKRQPGPRTSEFEGLHVRYLALAVQPVAAHGRNERL